MPSSIKPSPIALVVCDAVYQEPGGKTALVGLFNNIRTRVFPVTHARICVYSSVTDIHPGTNFRVDIVHSETERPVAMLEGPAPEGTMPTTICDFVFEINNATFPEAGRYYIRFFGNDHLLLQRPFEVSKLEE
jgi:hypothetical protein